MPRLPLSLSILLLAILSLAAPAQAEQRHWDLATAYAADDFHTRNIREFADDVALGTAGELLIRIHPAERLVQHQAIKDAVIAETVTAGEFLLSLHADRNPLFALDTLPFLATDFTAARRLWDASRPAVRSALARRNLLMLFSVPWPPQGIYSRRPIETIEDLQGLRIRVYSPIGARFVELVGAQPVMVEAAGLAQAFADERVDAMITSATTGVESGAWTFTTHFTVTGAWLPRNMVVVNRDAFLQLDPAQQRAVLAAARQAEHRGWEYAEDEDRRQRAVLEASGMTLYALPDELLAQLEDVGRQMRAEWRAATGHQGEAILEAFRIRNENKPKTE